MKLTAEELEHLKAAWSWLGRFIEAAEHVEADIAAEEEGL